MGHRENQITWFHDGTEEFCFVERRVWDIDPNRSLLSLEFSAQANREAKAFFNLVYPIYDRFPVDQNGRQSSIDRLHRT